MNTLSTRIILIICTSMLAPCANSYGQKSTKKLKVYMARISTKEQEKPIKGVLEEIRDSSVVVSTAKERVRIPASAIQEIKIKRKGAVGRGALAGGLTGLGLGLMIGFASGDDECDPNAWCILPMTAEEKAMGAGVFLGICGAATGIIIGSVSKAEKISINGNQGTFKKNLEVMKKYAIQNNLQ